MKGHLLSEYTEIESGKKKDRAILKAAINHAHREGAILVVKKLDRLSRGGLGILLEMEDKGVRFIECDSPHDNDLIREIKLSLARDEARAISNRTKAALGVIKAKLDRGETHVSKSGNIVNALGKPQNLTGSAIDKSVAVRKKAAKDNPDNTRATAMIVTLADTGMSFYQITKKINDAGFVTSRGNKFSEVQTKRLYDRFKT